MALLKIDIDRNIEDFDYLAFNQTVDFVEGMMRIKFDRAFYRSKGGNVHVMLNTDAFLEDLEVLALQAILGSDWKRELHNLCRIRRGQKNWNILFKHLEVSV